MDLDIITDWLTNQKEKFLWNFLNPRNEIIKNFYSYAGINNNNKLLFTQDERNK